MELKITKTADSTIRLSVNANAPQYILDILNENSIWGGWDKSYVEKGIAYISFEFRPSYAETVVSMIMF